MDKFEFHASRENNKIEESSKVTVRPKILTTESVIKSSETVLTGLGLSILGVGIIRYPNLTQ